MPRHRGERFEIARSVGLSVCLSVCPRRSCLGYRHAGCLQLSHRRPPPEMCELRTRPRTDVDLPRFLDRTAIGGGISSRRPRGDTLLLNRVAALARCGLLLQAAWRSVVCVFVCHDRESCKWLSPHRCRLTCTIGWSQGITVKGGGGKILISGSEPYLICTRNLNICTRIEFISWLAK